MTYCMVMLHGVVGVGSYVDVKRIDQFVKFSDNLLTASDGSAPSHATLAKCSSKLPCSCLLLLLAAAYLS